VIFGGQGEIVRKQSAKKALRVSLKRKEANRKIKEGYKRAIKKGDVSLAYSLLDRAASKKTIHKNKAARLKSRLATKPSKKIEKPKAKTAVKKPKKIRKSKK